MLGAIGSFFAVSATTCTGRRRASDTSDTMTGVTAALTTVADPNRREANNVATADAMLAMTNTNVCSEIRRLRRYPCSLRYRAR